MLAWVSPPAPGFGRIEPAAKTWEILRRCRPKRIGGATGFHCAGIATVVDAHEAPIADDWDRTAAASRSAGVPNRSLLPYM
jgi:hypothetical protein